VAIDVVLLVDGLLVDIKNAGAESVAHLQTGAGLRSTIVILTKKRTTCVIRSVAIAKLASTRVRTNTVEDALLVRQASTLIICLTILVAEH
jgi:hypothetical protein